MWIPAGRYRLESFGCTVAGKGGTRWYISSRAASEQTAKTLNIKSGADTKLALGQRLTASIDVKQDGNKLSLSLKLASADGWPCTIQRTDDKGDPPDFKVLSKSGEVLMSGKFAYG